MVELIAIAVVFSILGYVAGWLHWNREERQLRLQMINQAREVQAPVAEPERDHRLARFSEFQLIEYRRGNSELRFALQLDDLTPLERQIRMHRLHVYADGQIALELQFNVDHQDDDVPF